MQRLHGFIEKGYRFEVKVPTTIFDEQVAIITAYRGRTYVADRVIFPLKSLPYWDVPCQAILLRKKDDKRLRREENKLLERLPKKEDIPGNQCNNRRVFG